ncbi:MAG: hypothetical protein J2P37_32405 [Ktedonobacteraceae bacterium]|nr:hypothetical protein [Ktedonobacteraceae bacterium]
MHLSRTALLADLYQLANLLTESHPDPYSNCGGPLAFRRHVAQLASAIPDSGMKTTSFLRLLRPLVASLRDGHTNFIEPSAEKPSARFWLEWNIVEKQLYIAQVYRSEDRTLLGARLQAINEVSFAELLERIIQFHGFDNEYGQLVYLSHLLTNPQLLCDLLQLETAPLSLHFQLLLPDGVSQIVTLSAAEQQPGEPIEPASSIPMPYINTAQMGWSFLDKQHTTAYLRIDSLLYYREAFELAFARGNTGYLQRHLSKASGDILEETLPENPQERIALIPSATDLLRDLFSSMREARTSYLVVDLRFCRGGNSTFGWILDYFLYGLQDSIAHFDDGYQIKRYSAHYFHVNSKLSPEEEQYQQALRNGGYDFTEEEAWLRRQHKGQSAEEKAQLQQTLETYSAMIPTFEQEYRSRRWETSWTPKTIVLMAAQTYSSGFDILVDLFQHGATLFGVPSAQAGNCFIDILNFTLTHSQLEGYLSFKRSFLFPTDPERGNLLQPDYVLTYKYLAAHHFDPHATVRLALETYPSLINHST